METEITEKVNRNGMIISRMPAWAKEVIKQVAFEEHCDDYGEAIAQFIRDATEYRILKEKFFNNDLNVKISVTQQVQESENKIKFANGKELNKGGIK